MGKKQFYVCLSVLTAILFVLGSPASRLVAAAPEQPVQGTSHEQGITDKEIFIGSCVPLTGILKMRGPSMTHGAGSYFNFINDQGGINGRTIQYTSCDDAFNPEKAIECFNSCIKSKVFAAAFVIGTAAAVKYIRMADLNKLPLVGFDVGPPPVCEFHPTVFGLRPCYRDEIVKQVAALTDHKLTKFCLIYQNDAFGACVREALETELKKHQRVPVVEVSCSRGGTDAEEAYNHAIKSPAEAIIMAVNTVALRQFMKRRREDKLKAVCTTLSPLEDALFEGGTESDGMLITQILPPLDSGEKTVELYKKLLKKNYPDDHPNTHGLECFLNAMVLVEGLKRVGTNLTRDKFVKAMESIHDFDLGIGSSYQVNFSSHNHVGWSNHVITLKVMHNGKLVNASDADFR